MRLAAIFGTLATGAASVAVAAGTFSTAGPEHATIVYPDKTAPAHASLPNVSSLSVEVTSTNSPTQTLDCLAGAMGADWCDAAWTLSYDGHPTNVVALARENGVSRVVVRVHEHRGHGYLGGRFAEVYDDIPSNAATAFEMTRVDTDRDGSTASGRYTCANETAAFGPDGFDCTPATLPVPSPALVAKLKRGLGAMSLARLQKLQDATPSTAYPMLKAIAAAIAAKR